MASQSGSEIRYRFAKGHDGKIVDILTLTVEMREQSRKFSCIACDEPMMARLGQKVARHFAHKPNGICSGETYLHLLGKAIFEEEYRRCLETGQPFWIEHRQRIFCNHRPGISESSCYYTKKPWPRVDLTKFLPDIAKEKREGKFQPDLILKSKSGRVHLFIEIAVTHESTEAKRTSKNRIIEVKAESEEDFDCFREHLLSEANPKTEFLNFKLKREVSDNLCSWFRCRLDERVFQLYDDRSWSITTFGIDGKLRSDPEKKVVWSTHFFTDRKFDSDPRSMVKECVRDAFFEGFTVRACFSCEHFDYWGEQRCQKFDESVQHTRAISCPHFSPRDNEELFGILNDG